MPNLNEMVRHKTGSDQSYCFPLVIHTANVFADVPTRFYKSFSDLYGRAGIPHNEIENLVESLENACGVRIDEVEIQDSQTLLNVASQLNWDETGSLIMANQRGLHVIAVTGVFDDALLVFDPSQNSKELEFEFRDPSDVFADSQVGVNILGWLFQMVTRK